MTIENTPNLQRVAERVFEDLDVKEKTRKEYGYFIAMFLCFISKEGLHSNSFLGYKKYLSQKTDISVSTKNKYLTTAKILLRGLHGKGIIPIDITQNVKAFSQSKKHKRAGISDDEITALVEYIKALPLTPQNTRLKAIICLLALQGLRQCEVIRLDVKDLDLASGIAHVRGKGQDDKEPIYLHPTAVQALANYLKVNKVADGAVFISNSNNNRNGRITTNALRQIVKEVLTALEISKTVHGFRHYFTTKLIEEYKGDLLEVAKYTRHKSLEMLQVYNDNVNRKADLPRFFSTFNGINF